MAPDGKMYNNSARKGELFELKQALNANSAKDRKNALKRVVAAMSLGRDMSSLFPDVVKNTTGDLSMKKLVYLYIINYAHANADLSLLIINTFLKDAADPNPLIRALSIRTMAMIPLEKITECLCEPLHAALQDRDPYVRKTAAISVAKLYDMNPVLAREEGFLEQLQKLVSDANPMTVANAVVALSEIAQSSDAPSLLPLNTETVPRLLSALSECTEWGQIFILDAICDYTPTDTSQADLMVERILPRLQHANPAVVLSSVRVIVSTMSHLDSDDKRSFLVKKMSAPLITLLTGQPEIQFVALRNLSILLRVYPNLLSDNVRVLFVSYADPFYVKCEKLDLMVQIADESNSDALLAEFAEYAGEVDVQFSKKAIESIATVAIRIQNCASRCVTLLSDLLSRKAQHLTEQIIIAVKDICRAYPRVYSTLASQLFSTIEEISDPSAKMALVWIIGEHANELPNSIEILETILTNIEYEPEIVQMQTVTACMKTFSAHGDLAGPLVKAALDFATGNCSNVEVRDRGIMYRRMLDLDQEFLRRAICGEKPVVFGTTEDLDLELHRELLNSLSSVAAVYHRQPSMFEGKKQKDPVGLPVGESMTEEDLLGLGDEVEDKVSGEAISEPAQLEAPIHGKSPLGLDLLDDLLGSDLPSTGSQLAIEYGQPFSDDLRLGSGSRSTVHSDHVVREHGIENMNILLPSAQGHGLEVRGKLLRSDDGQTTLCFSLSNHSESNMGSFAVQMNKNLFGFQVLGTERMPQLLATGSSITTIIEMDHGGTADTSHGTELQIAIKFNPGGVVYFAMDTSSLEAVLVKSAGGLRKDEFLTEWKAIADSSEVKTNLRLCHDAGTSAHWTMKRLEDHGIFTVVKKWNATPRMLYLCGTLSLHPRCVILAELSIPHESSIDGVIASRCSVSGAVGNKLAINFNEACRRLLNP